MAKKAKKLQNTKLRPAKEVDQNKVVSFLLAHPNLFTLSQLAREMKISKQFLQLILRSPKFQDQKLELLLVNQAKKTNHQVFTLITQNPHKYTSKEVGKLINQTSYSVLKKAVKLGLQELLVETPNHEDKLSQALELLKQNPRKYQVTELSNMFGINPVKLKLYAQNFDLISNIVVKKRVGISKEVIQLVKTHPNKYTAKEIAKLVNAQHGQTLKILQKHNLQSLIQNSNLDIKKDAIKLEQFIYSNPNQYTILELSQKLGINKARIYSLLKSGNQLSNLVLVRNYRK